jgi:hypothetical protein
MIRLNNGLSDFAIDIPETIAGSPADLLVSLDAWSWMIFFDSCTRLVGVFAREKVDYLLRTTHPAG